MPPNYNLSTTAYVT